MSQNTNTQTAPRPQDAWQIAAGDTDDWRGHTPQQQARATGYQPSQGGTSRPAPQQG